MVEVLRDDGAQTVQRLRGEYLGIKGAAYRRQRRIDELVLVLHGVENGQCVGRAPPTPPDERPQLLVLDPVVVV
jgi:hypothetical protein